MTSAVGGWSVKPLSGFSLVEMLVVLVVVGILYALAGSTVGLLVSNGIEDEAERLANRVRLAQDESVVRSQVLALGFDAKGYAFFAQNDRGEWETLSEAGLLMPYALPKGYVQSLVLAGQTVVLDKIHPQVYLFPTGEMTPFAWRVEYAGNTMGLRVDAQGGQLQVDEGGDAASR